MEAFARYGFMTLRRLLVGLRDIESPAAEPISVRRFGGIIGVNSEMDFLRRRKKEDDFFARGGGTFSFWVRLRSSIAGAL